jgi:hemerythrin
MEKKNESHSVLMAHNIFIVWKPEYNLGIPIIDEQHRGIVTSINTLHYCMLNDYVKETLVPIIDMMNDYTHVHFQIEEGFLEKISFPHAKRHHELHEELTDKLKDTGRNSMLDRDPYPFMDFLKKWWIDHICTEDLVFKKFIES